MWRGRTTRYISRVFDFLADVVGGILDSTGTGSNKSKAYAAYKAAWIFRRDGDDALDALVSSMKTKNVHGIYTEPEKNPDLAPFFEAWAAGIPPNEVKTYIRQAQSN